MRLGRLALKVDLDDFRELRVRQPRLLVGLCSTQIVGWLDISGYYDSVEGAFVGAGWSGNAGSFAFLADRFLISINLGDRDTNGWPKVYERSQRRLRIADRLGVSQADLHFYQGGNACLGLAYPWDPFYSLRDFVRELIEPFFYRLAYVDIYGLEAARLDLWPEYSHGDAGLREHRHVVLRGLAGMRHGRS